MPPACEASACSGWREEASPSAAGYRPRRLLHHHHHLCHRFGPPQYCRCRCYCSSPRLTPCGKQSNVSSSSSVFLSPPSKKKRNSPDLLSPIGCCCCCCYRRWRLGRRNGWSRSSIARLASSGGAALRRFRRHYSGGTSFVSFFVLFLSPVQKGLETKTKTKPKTRRS